MRTGQSAQCMVKQCNCITNSTRTLRWWLRGLARRLGVAPAAQGSCAVGNTHPFQQALPLDPAPIIRHEATNALQKYRIACAGGTLRQAVPVAWSLQQQPPRGRGEMQPRVA